MKTKFVHAAFAVPAVAALFLSGGAMTRADDDNDDDGPVATATAQATATSGATATPRPTSTPNGSQVTSSQFSLPVTAVVTVNGQSANVSGTLSGTSTVRQTGSGILQVRADVQGTGITVTLANGTVLRGTGGARVIGQIRENRGGDSLFNSLIQVTLSGPNSTTYSLTARVQVRVDANRQVTVRVLQANVSGPTASDDDGEENGLPTTSQFSLPLSGTVEASGQSASFSGTLSGTARVFETGSGILQVRADLVGSGITVTLANGTVLRGSGTARIVGRMRATQGDSLFNALVTVNLTGPNNTAYSLTARVQVRVDSNRQVTVRVLQARLSGPTGGTSTQPTTSQFRLPINAVITANGQNANVAGTLSGTATVRPTGSGILQVQASVLGSGITVTLADGTVLRAPNEVRLSLAGQVRDLPGGSSFTTLTTVVLAAPNNTTYRLAVQLQVRVSADRQVTIAIQSARLSNSIPAA